MVQDRTPGGRGRSSRRPSLREDTTNREPKTSAYTAHQERYAAGPRQPTPGAVGNDVPSPHRPKVQNYLDRLHGMREAQRQRLFPSQGTQSADSPPDSSPPRPSPPDSSPPSRGRLPDGPPGPGSEYNVPSPPGDERRRRGGGGPTRVNARERGELNRY